MRYFVMLRSQGGFPLPLIDLEDDPVLFETREEAEAAAKKNIIGEHFGFEVYEW